MLTQEQTNAVLAAMESTGKRDWEVFAEQGIAISELRGFRGDNRSAVAAALDRHRRPPKPMDQWTQEQLQEEINRLSALRLAKPKKAARIDAMIAEIEALLE